MKALNGHQKAKNLFIFFYSFKTVLLGFIYKVDMVHRHGEAPVQFLKLIHFTGDLQLCT